MASVSDYRFTRLRALGYTGATNDMLLAWLQSYGAASDSINDAWAQMLTVQGFPLSTHGSVQDAWWALLKSRGYSGALADMEYDFWRLGDGTFGPSVWILATGVWNDIGRWMDSSFWID